MFPCSSERSHPHGSSWWVLLSAAATLFLANGPSLVSAADPAVPVVLRAHLTVTSPLQYSNTPMDPIVDFPELIRQAGLRGVLDPNSIELWDTEANDPVPHAISEDVMYSDRVRIEFVISDPKQTEYEICFRVADKRPSIQSKQFVPQIGVGDLLRYNSAKPRPITVPYSPGLHDLNGDGLLDLTGTWNYAHRPGLPWDGAIVYPRTQAKNFEFGELIRLRHVAGEDHEPRFFNGTHMGSDYADFDGDNRLDLVTTLNGKNEATFFLNTGRQEVSGLPQFEAAHSVRIDGWQACRAVDLNNDGAIDLVVDGHYIRNQNPDGWPFQAADAIQLNAGPKPGFVDLDEDGFLDAVCLHGAETVQPDFYQVAWRRNLGKTPPEFAPEELLLEIDVPHVSMVSPWSGNGHSGLLVQYNAFQNIAIYEFEPQVANTRPADRTTPRSVSETASVDTTVRRRLQYKGQAQSTSAVMSLSDQAWPYLCDWDDDGDLDLLIGGGYGWLRIVINDGTRQRPAYREPAEILSSGKPIRILRNEILGEPSNWHDMGYAYPVFVDWDSDGLKDLVCPNETNRILWYQNTGTKNAPQFDLQQQILCDGYPDTPDARSLSNQRANDPKSNNGVYPLEKERPFMWRTGTAIADFNGDTLMDLVTHDGLSRVATLFVQYRNEDGTLRLRKDEPLKLDDGRSINDTIVDRRAHWTESFRTVDWNADGLQDILYSVAGAMSGTKDNGSIYLLRNVGTKTSPLFAAPETMRCFGEPIRITSHGPHPCCGDFDGDGKPDLIACVEWSVYPFYSHAALMMKERPTYTLRVLRDTRE
jgi:hypothetical protein